jgi:hypothetical protein
VLIEIQLGVDPDKPYAWLVYQATAQHRHRCPVVVLVVAPELQVAQWARRRRPAGPRGRYAPVVLGPAEVPELTLEALRHSPELAVLSALAHPPDAEVLRTLAEAIGSLEPGRAGMYLEVLRSKLGDAMRRVMEAMMIRGEPLVDVFKKYWKEGKEEGKELGRAEGKELGRAEGIAVAVIGFLEARSLIPDQAQRAAILACTDKQRLERWVARAATVQSVAELLGDS